MKFRVAAGLALAALAQPAFAQDTAREALHASFALWGMMEAMANYCTEQVPGDLSFTSAHLTWQAENILIEDELEIALGVSGEPETLSAEGRAAGHDGILDIVRPATNPDEVCMNWKAETESGGYDAETFLGYQLGILRERDGL